ncbi:MAG TPA: hypothetical protein VFU86_19470 [Terriglobales bacterium]|nr:hypothetical protein [Terriglobales bacterium]
MDSRRGNVFFWIAQVLLAPAWVCFAATVALRFGASSPILLKVGLANGFVQVPATALAFLFALTAGMGEILSRKRLVLLYSETAIAVAVITLVFLFRGVYRR